jgi:dienelactone hydrolase
MNGKIAFLVAFSLIVFAACGTDAGNVDNSRSPIAGESPVMSTEVAGMPASETVKVDSEGGVEIVGTYYPPKEAESPGVVLLHQWYSDRGSFDAFAKKLQNAGFAALAIDGRGFGESTKTIGGDTVGVSNSLETVKAMLVDVHNAVRYISKQKGVDGQRIAIVGSSYGSSQAIMYAGDHPDVKAVALLSPGLNYFSTMATGPAAEKFGSRPLFAVASEEDKESVEAVKAFEKMKGDAQGNYFKVYPGKAHGTDIFKADAKLEPDLLVFLKKSL